MKNFVPDFAAEKYRKKKMLNKEPEQINNPPRPKVMVSGCFDLLHSGHVAFLREAATHGELHVCIGSDRTIHGIKGRYTVNDERERRYMLEALASVHAVHIGSGTGQMDFVPEFEDRKSVV
mgnify:CR=1 FL=1